MPKVVSRASTAPGVCFGVARYGPGGVFGPRRQGEHQLVVIEQGRLDVEVDRRVYGVEEGGAILLAPGGWEMFRFWVDGETVHTWCWLDVPSGLGRGYPQVPVVGEAGPLVSQMVRLGSRFASGPSSGGALRSLAEASIAAFLNGVEPQDAGWPATVRRAVRLMEGDLRRDWKAAEIAEAVGMSSSGLGRQFQRFVGEGVVARLWRLRTATAVGLLEGTGLLLAEVAEQTGFSNPYHLSRRVKEATGMSPRELRSRRWGR